MDRPNELFGAITINNFDTILVPGSRHEERYNYTMRLLTREGVFIPSKPCLSAVSLEEINEPFVAIGTLYNYGCYTVDDLFLISEGYNKILLENLSDLITFAQYIKNVRLERYLIEIRDKPKFELISNNTFNPILSPRSIPTLSSRSIPTLSSRSIPTLSPRSIPNFNSTLMPTNNFISTPSNNFGSVLNSRSNYPGRIDGQRNNLFGDIRIKDYGNISVPGSDIEERYAYAARLHTREGVFIPTKPCTSAILLEEINEPFVAIGTLYNYGCYTAEDLFLIPREHDRILLENLLELLKFARYINNADLETYLVELSIDNRFTPI